MSAIQGECELSWAATMMVQRSTHVASKLQQNSSERVRACLHFPTQLCPTPRRISRSGASCCNAESCELCRNEGTGVPFMQRERPEVYMTGPQPKLKACDEGVIPNLHVKKSGARPPSISAPLDSESDSYQSPSTQGMWGFGSVAYLTTPVHCVLLVVGGASGHTTDFLSVVQ